MSEKLFLNEKLSLSGRPEWGNYQKGQGRYQLNSVEEIQAPSYKFRSYGTEYPVYSEIVSPDPSKYPQVLPNGMFIGSLPITIAGNGTDWVDIDDAINNSTQRTSNWKLFIPSFENLDNLDTLFSKIGDLTKTDSTKLTWKEVRDVEDIAERIKAINPDDYQIIIEILSSQWLALPNTVRELFSPTFKAIITNYTVRNIPDKEPEYDDLSAYLKAPFPKLNLETFEESDELKEILDKLKELDLESLDIPLVKVENKDLTERDTGGDGIFDVMMYAIYNQLLKLRADGLVTHNEIAEIYKSALVQNIQVASQYALEKANILNQSYNTRINAVQASLSVLQTKAEMLMLPLKIKALYADLELKLKQLELSKVQIEIEKEKFPQVVAQTDLILAQTDGQRLQNEQVQVGIQQGKLSLVQTQEQIALMEEQNKQARIQTNTAELNHKQAEISLQVQEKTSEYNVNQAKIAMETADEQRKVVILQGNKLVEDTKLTDAQTQQTLKQVMLADVQKLTAEAQVKIMAQQLEKEKESLGLVKAQIASAFAQLALYKDQLVASRAQYSDTINGKPIGGLLGAQILANKVQASSLERKAFMEVVSQLQSGWAANKTADIAIKSPSAFTPIVVDKAIQWGFEKYFNMPADMMNLPYGYSQYLSDDEMDGLDTERGVAMQETSDGSGGKTKQQLRP